mmetsp:Transcript_95374/g.169336  ORF Transcript_95374/g.169336 Transcript_95374/m.169336 type:complete len:271 (+) Transcript_95374:3-815(+)
MAHGGDGKKVKELKKKTVEQLVQDLERKEAKSSLKHLDSCGKQVLSTIQTSPVTSFGRSPRFAEIPKPVKQAKPISQGSVMSANETSLTESGSAAESASGRATPATPVPRGEQVYIPEWRSTLSSVTPVLKGWSTSPRFLGDNGYAAKNASTALVTSTHASPFSRTFPYEEPKKRASEEEEEADANAKANAKYAQFQKEFRERGERYLEYQASPELCKLRLSKQRPAWSFGHSDKGARIPGLEKPKRNVDFRELRDKIELAPGVLNQVMS